MKSIGGYRILPGVWVFFLLLFKQTIALSPDEIAAFGARNHTDPNTGLQGFITITEFDELNYVITANGIPDHVAGPYPNDNDSSVIIAQDFVYYILKTPVKASNVTELPMGTIGLALNGVPYFNPYTRIGTDAVENELFDSCDGHPTPEAGTYHYHDHPGCVFDFHSGVPSEVVGVALDGYPIYGHNDENGTELTSSDLDECHGRVVNGSYQYHITEDFPYIMGCYRGVVDERNMMGGGDRPERPTGDPPGQDPSGDPPGQNPSDDPGGDAMTLTCRGYVQLLLLIVSLSVLF